MELVTETVDGLTVACPSGRLDFGAAGPFQQQIEALVAQAGAGVLVDGSALEYVSSAGLRVFLVGAKAAKAAGVGFGVCALRPAVKEVFDLTGFGKVVAVFGDRAAALATLGKPGA